MEIKIVESHHMYTLKTFNCNATYQLPRLGEYVRFGEGFYKVARICHNLEEEYVTLTVIPE